MFLGHTMALISLTRSSCPISVHLPLTSSLQLASQGEISPFPSTPLASFVLGFILAWGESRFQGGLRNMGAGVTGVLTLVWSCQSSLTPEGKRWPWDQALHRFSRAALPLCELGVRGTLSADWVSGTWWSRNSLPAVQSPRTAAEWSCGEVLLVRTTAHLSRVRMTKCPALPGLESFPGMWHFHC